jgi:hypothetical protein
MSRKINEHASQLTDVLGVLSDTRVVSSQHQHVDRICGEETRTEDNIIRKNCGVPGSEKGELPINEFVVFGRERVIAGWLFVYVYLV